MSSLHIVKTQEEEKKQGAWPHLEHAPLFLGCGHLALLLVSTASVVSSVTPVQVVAFIDRFLLPPLLAPSSALLACYSLTRSMIYLLKTRPLGSFERPGTVLPLGALLQ